MSITDHEASQLNSVEDIVRWGAACFDDAEIYFGHGTNNAADEALTIALHVLNIPFEEHEENLSRQLSAVERNDILAMYERRVKERLPVPYLTNEAWFTGLRFYVDERVLIPRSPIAELIEDRFSPWIEQDKVHRILDLCTGSGCIAIASALALPQAIVDAVDLSQNALVVTRLNIELYKLADRVIPIVSDVFSNLQGQRYDIIVSNPPYVDSADMKSMPQEYNHEPEMGLAAGEQGLDIVVRILSDAVNFMTDNGILIVEVGNSAKALVEKLPMVPFMWLEFERGGEGVFLLTADQLKEFQYNFKNLVTELSR